MAPGTEDLGLEAAASQHGHRAPARKRLGEVLYSWGPGGQAPKYGFSLQEARGQSKTTLHDRLSGPRKGWAPAPVAQPILLLLAQEAVGPPEIGPWANITGLGSRLALSPFLLPFILQRP